MAVSDVLRNLRNAPSSVATKNDSGVSRTIQLTEEELKSIPPPEPGAEVTLEMTGKLEDGQFRVMTVSGQGGIEGEGPDVNADAESVMTRMRGPVAQAQTIPSPG